MEVVMYVITGATGHTGNVIVEALLAKGEKVRAIGRNADRLKPFAAQGAEPFVADATDSANLAKAFAGAKAVYVMIPPNPATPDVFEYQKRVTDAMAGALRSAGVTHVVTLSSLGADKPDKTGPVVGLHYLEQKLNGIDRLNALHLRAGYFMENTLAQVGVIQKTGTAATPLRPDLKISMIATRDIGVAAAQALLNLTFRQKQTRELLGQRDISYSDVASIIGKAVGKPNLRYTQAPNEQMRGIFVQAGMSPNMADSLLEMCAAMNSGYMRPLEPRSAQNTTPTSYETFVTEEFLPLYEGKSAAA
jgi:uncharacterized protein YbjT (DUF2867 family)